MRALLGTASHFCEAIDLKSRTVPNGTGLKPVWTVPIALTLHLLLLDECWDLRVQSLGARG